MPLADGPAMYFGGTIETFALPLGAFIVIATVLFYLLRAKHTGPRLKYLTTASVTSVTTREPGPASAPPVAAAAAEAATEPETRADEATEPETTTEAETAAAAEVTAEAETTAKAETDAEAETTAESESEK